MSENIDLGAITRDKDLTSQEGRPRGRKRRKVSYLTVNKITSVDYKDVAVLRRFINDRGKILSSRQTGATAKEQRMVARAIRRARELALLPYVVAEMSSERKEGGSRYSRSSERAQAPQEPAAAEVEIAAPPEAGGEAPPVAEPEAAPQAESGQQPNE
jgi:small subunit ribosomal protein S18